MEKRKIMERAFRLRRLPLNPQQKAQASTGKMPACWKGRKEKANGLLSKEIEHLLLSGGKNNGDKSFTLLSPFAFGARPNGFLFLLSGFLQEAFDGIYRISQLFIVNTIMDVLAIALRIHQACGAQNAQVL